MKKIISLILTLALMLSVMPVLPAAAEETETTAPVETAVPAEETTAPAEETTAPTEETTAPTEETTASTEAATAPTEETTASTEAATAPTEAATVPTEETTAPTEVPAEAPTETPNEGPDEAVPVETGKWSEGATEYSYEVYEVPGLMARSLDGYSDVETAALELRGQLQQRATNIIINVRSTGEPMYNFALYDRAVAHTGDPLEGDYIRYHVRRIQEEGSVFIFGGEYYCTLNFTVEYNSSFAQEIELTLHLADLMEQLNLTGKSDYQKIKTIYDYITHNVTYDYEHVNDENYNLMYSAYAAVIHKTCVCQGYANLFYRMALTAGIDCRIIDGIGNGGSHAWNIVRLNGVYYDIDSTWDSNYAVYDAPYEFFLRCDANFTDHYRSDRFCTQEFYSQYPMSSTDYPVPTETENPEEVQVGDFVFTVQSGKAILKAYTGNAQTVVIPEMVSGVSVKEIGEGAFMDCTSITSVTIPDSVWSIGLGAFFGCSNLERVVLPDNLQYTDAWVFTGCEKLKEIVIPDKMMFISGYSFLGCISLEKVSIPDSVTIIAVGAFSSCESLESITIPGSVTEIGESVFGGCANLKNIYFQGNAPLMAEDVFYDVTATAYYPADDPTWTADVMQNYGGNITWTSYDPVILGDVNGDGKITAIDAAMIYAAVNNKKVLTDAEFKAADVDGSGKIQAKDAAMVYAHVNNKLDKFPAEK